MTDISESRRKRIAILLLSLGAGFMLLGVGIFLVYGMEGSLGVVAQPPPRVPNQTRVWALKQMLFWIVVFVLIFMVSTLAFLRWSRHFRRSLLRGPRPPTPSEDVWAMHKLPEGAVEEWTEPLEGDSDADSNSPPA